jgi:hypothetical protein
MAHIPRHKNRYGNLPWNVNRPTTHPVLSNRLPAPSRTMSAREKRLRAEAEKEMLRRRLARFQQLDKRGPVMPLPAPAAPDPRFQKWLPGDDRGMVDPTNIQGHAVNYPPEYYQHPAVQQKFAADKRAEEMKRRGWTQNRFHPDMRGLPQMPPSAPNDERAEILKARKQKFLEREAQELAARQKMREQTGGAAPTQVQIEESLGRYADSRRNQLTPLAQEANIERDLKEREANQFNLLEAIQEGGLSLSPGSATQTGVQEVAKNLVQKRADQLRRNLVGSDDQTRNVSRPRPEKWMEGRLGLQDPTWTSKVPGVDAQQAANMAQARRRQLELEAAAKIRQPTVEPWMRNMIGGDPGQLPAGMAGAHAQQAANMADKRRRELNLAAPGLEGQVFDDDRPTGAEIQAGVQGLLGQYPENVSGAVPDYGYWEQRANTLRQRKREEDFAKSQRDQATAFEQMEPTKPSFTQRALSQVLGIPVDLVAAGLNPLLEVLGAPEDVIKNPVGGREWLLKYFQTGGAAAVQNAKDALKTVYPAVVKGAEVVGDVVDTTVQHWKPGIEGVIDDTTKFLGDKAKSAAEAVGVDSASQIPGQLINDALMYYSEAPGDQIKSDIKSAGSALLDATGIPPALDELRQWAEKNVKPVTKQMGREFDERYALKQLEGQVFDDDPEEGLLEKVDVDKEGGLLGVDVTNVPPSERPYGRGTGWPGPGLDRPTHVPTKKEEKKEDKEVVAKAGKDIGVSTVRGSTELDPATRAGLERVWGKHTYNPAQRRKQYMSQLKNIYQKAAWLDAIAAISGGKSRSSSYIERAVGMMDAMQKFDQEERVYNIWRDVYYDKDGTYDPPKSKKEAAERARRLGANPEETKSIYGWAEEGEDLQQWYRDDGKGGYETTTVKGKKTGPKGEGWIMGKPPTPRTPAKKQYIWAIPPGQTEAIYMDKDVVAGQQGWTQSSIDKSGGLYGQSLRQASAFLQEDPPNEAAAKAVLRQFYSRDHVTAGLFPENIDKVIDSLIESIRVSSGSAAAAQQQQQQTAAPATLEDAVAAAIAHPSNAGKNPQEVRFDVEVWWQKNRGGG